jgi:phenylpropionate dioxygenase-like ring-hydroxylating dioxygenase large terminal subunit
VPEKEANMFLRNAWYVAAWDHEVSADRLFNRILLDQPLVLYRKRDGSVVALEDRCCHRHYPLHKGTLTDDCIRCHYHGFTYDAGGACVRIPGQSHVPDSARVMSYPVVERHRWIWVWMGEPALADESKIVDFHWLDDPRWRAKGTVLYVKSSYELIVENLLDLTHLAFVHQATIGNYATAERAEVTTQLTDHDVTVARWMMDSPPPPTYAKLGGFRANIDRWQFINFTPPGFVRLDVGGLPTAGGARELKPAAFAGEGRLDGGIEMRNLNAITPETEKTTHYFWAQAHNFLLDEPAVTDMLFEQICATFREDWEVFETQQRWIDLAPDASRVNVRADAGQIQGMRLLRKKIEEEAQAARA